NAQQARLGEQNLQPEADPDLPDERDHQRLDQAEAFLLQKQNQQNVERGQAHPPDQGNVKKQVECDGGSDDFGQIAGGNRDLRPNPEHKRHRPAEVVAAGGGQVAPRHHSQFDGQGLQQNGHQVGQHDDGKQRVI